MPETPDQLVARKAREQMDARALEAAKIEACQAMGWTAELNSAIEAIRVEIARGWARKDLDDRAKQMNEAQLNYALAILRKRRNERAEEAVELWKQASGKSSEQYK